MTTHLHYTDVLSVSDGRLVSRDGMDGVCRCVDAIAGPGVTTLAIAYLAAPCKAYLREKFPCLAAPEVEAGITAALADCEAAGARGDFLELWPHLDRRVLPLLAGDWFDVEHLGEKETGDLLGGYAGFLDEKLKGKNVIPVFVE